MINPPDYAAAERAARSANAENLRNNITSVDVLTKIRNWAERNSLEPEFVRYKLLTDDTFALHFVKDPSRQSLHQTVAARHIKQQLPLVEDFHSLPASGAKAEYVVSGMVVSGTQHALMQSEGKSIDFKWAYGRDGHTFRVYATHKHTKEEGGSQDNQFQDVKLFLEAAQRCTDPSILFLAICDGEYYQRPYDGESSRIASLQRDYGRRRVRACTISTLPLVLAKQLQEWLRLKSLTATDVELAAFERMGLPPACSLSAGDVSE